MNGGASFLLMLRVVVSLGLVMAMCWGGVWAMKRRGGGRLGLRNADGLQVVERRALSKSAAVAIVRVNGEDLLIGVTDHHVRLLHRPGTGDRAAIPVGLAADEPSATGPLGALAPADTTTIDLVDHETAVDLTSLSEPAPAHRVGALLGRTTMGARRTGSLTPPATAGGPARMGFFEALRELTVRRS